MNQVIKDKILKKENILGTHLTMGNLWIADIFGMSGFDFVWIDTEHSSIDYTSLLECITILKAHKTAVFVRTQQNDFNHTKKLLDMGADGIIFPMVNSAEEALKCMNFTFYPPKGIRGFGPNKAIDYGFANPKEYMESEQSLCRFVQIETPTAIENLEEIMKVPDIDGFIIGPCDMAVNTTGMCDFSSEESMANIKKAVEILKNNNKFIGISINSCDKNIHKKWREMGINMISAGSDISYIVDGATKMFKNKYPLAV